MIVVLKFFISRKIVSPFLHPRYTTDNTEVKKRDYR